MAVTVMNVEFGTIYYYSSLGNFWSFFVQFLGRYKNYVNIK